MCQLRILTLCPSADTLAANEITPFFDERWWSKFTIMVVLQMVDHRTYITKEVNKAKEQTAQGLGRLVFPASSSSQLSVLKRGREGNLRAGLVVFDTKGNELSALLVNLLPELIMLPQNPGKALRYDGIAGFRPLVVLALELHNKLANICYVLFYSRGFVIVRRGGRR